MVCYWFHLMVGEHKRIDQCFLELQRVRGLLRSNLDEDIGLPSFAKSISITISTLTSPTLNPFPMLSHYSSLTSIKHSLVSRQKHHEQILSFLLTPSTHTATPYTHYTDSLISLYTELTQESNPTTLKAISKSLSDQTKQPESTEPVQSEQTTIFEALGQAEQVEYTTEDPGIHQIDFDMSTLKSALKQPSHKVLYKQVSPTGSIKVSDKPLVFSAPSEPVSSIRQVQSFRDFLIIPQKSVITLEGLGENSDNEA